MKRKLWIAFLVVVLAVSLAVIVYSVSSAKSFTGPIETKPLICKAASVYTDGTIIERPCPASADGAEGLRMILPEPGQFYRPGGVPQP